MLHRREQQSGGCWCVSKRSASAQQPSAPSLDIQLAEILQLRGCFHTITTAGDLEIINLLQLDKRGLQQ